MSADRGIVLTCASVIAALAWAGILSEAITSLSASKDAGRTTLGSIAFFYQFFTNQVVTGLACVMSLTVLGLVCFKTMLGARIYAACVVYLVVMAATYELLLRRLWSPRGFWFARDALMHDLLPILTLLFWFFLAPKTDLRWSDPLIWLAYPMSYFAITLLVGQTTGSYPYAFLDPGLDGGTRLLVRVLVLAAAFYAAGLAVVGAARLVR